MPDIIQGDGFGAQPGPEKPKPEPKTAPFDDSSAGQQPAGGATSQPASAAPPGVPELKQEANNYMNSWYNVFITTVLGVHGDKYSTGGRNTCAAFATRGITAKFVFTQINNYDCVRVRYSITDATTVEDGINLASLVLGQDEIEGVFSDEDLRSPQTLADFFPEMQEFIPYLKGDEDFYNVHPFAIVMGLKPEFRDLAAVAIGKRLESMFKDWLDTHHYGKYFENFRDLEKTDAFLRKMAIPTSREMIDIDKQYSAKLFVPTQKDIKRVLDEYKSVTEVFR
jgi:hypothetical protein